MRPTLRGIGVAVVGGGAIGMAYAAGPRALNAIAAPAVVALVAGVTQILLADLPDVDRSAPPAGFPGESRTIQLDVGGSGVARIVDALPDGLAATDHDLRATLPANVSYDVELTRRGEWTVGPPTIVVTDVLGLFVRTFEPEGETTALVYPEVYDLGNNEAFAGLFKHGTTNDRQAFDSIREYAPGDPLRDVHWKSSAKRGDDELVVKQFVAEQATDEFHVAASATEGNADAMAAGAASVALMALSAGLSVSVTCPAGSLQAGRGETHRSHVLELLARTGAGGMGDRTREHADLLLHATDESVTVTVDGDDYALDLGGAASPAGADGATATPESTGTETATATEVRR